MAWVRSLKVEGENGLGDFGITHDFLKTPVFSTGGCTEAAPFRLSHHVLMMRIPN